MPDENLPDNDPKKKSTNHRVSADTTFLQLRQQIFTALRANPEAARVMPTLDPYEQEQVNTLAWKTIRDCDCQDHECLFWKWVGTHKPDEPLVYRDFAEQIGKYPMYVTRLIPKAVDIFAAAVEDVLPLFYAEYI